MKKVQIVTIDEEFEKAQVKGFVRTRKGKLERVSPFERKGEKKKKLISEKRIQNIKNALSFIDWDKPKVRIHGMYGDRPQLELKGKYKDYEVIYRTASPAGGSASLRILRGGKIIGSVIPGALSKLGDAKGELDSRISTGYGKPSLENLRKWREGLKQFNYKPLKTEGG